MVASEEGGSCSEGAVVLQTTWIGGGVGECVSLGVEPGKNRGSRRQRVGEEK